MHTGNEQLEFGIKNIHYIEKKLFNLPKYKVL